MCRTEERALVHSLSQRELGRSDFIGTGDSSEALRQNARDVFGKRPCLLDVNLDNAVQAPKAGSYRRRTLTRQPWGRPLSATLSFPVAVGVVKTSRL